MRLYLDDIELIQSVFQENDYTIQIADKEFQFDSLDELVNKRGITPSYFEFHGTENNNHLSPSVYITFENKRIYMHSHAYGQNNSKVVFTRIKDIFESHVSKIYKILNPWIYFPFLIILLIPYVSALTKDKEKAFSESTGLLSLIVVFFVAFFISGCYREIRHQVVLRRRHQGGFWKQNVDKIFLLILGALIGIIVKFILELVWKSI